MKFKYKQNHSVVQTIKDKMTGVVTGRFVACKFDENGELETNDPKLIHVLQTRLPGCTWEGVEHVKTEDIKDILSDDELRQLAKENGIKSYHNKKISKIKKELKELGVF